MDALSLDRYVVDTLMADLVGHDRKPSAYLVYLAVAACEGRVALGYGELAERTGLSRRACQQAVAHLQRRGLISATRRSANEAAVYRALRPWIRPKPRSST
jgi:DNA-binding MarR family transcriptional regulator